MTRDELLDALLAERYGPCLPAQVKPTPHPGLVRLRRQILTEATAKKRRRKAAAS